MRPVVSALTPNPDWLGVPSTFHLLGEQQQGLERLRFLQVSLGETQMSKIRYYLDMHDNKEGNHNLDT